MRKIGGTGKTTTIMKVLLTTTAVILEATESICKHVLPKQLWQIRSYVQNCKCLFIKLKACIPEGAICAVCVYDIVALAMLLLL